MYKMMLAAALAVTLAAGAARADDDSEGEVRKIDRDAGKITLKHGEIKPLDMPPMTMVFEVRDKALLDGLQPGDRVRFRAVHEGGKYRVTQIRPAR
jgi:Cu/Ag efflux protein CusF